MNRIVGSAAAIMLLFGLAPMALAQDGATQKQIDQRDPDFCGAGGAGCDPAEVQQWKAVGNKLADLSSATSANMPMPVQSIASGNETARPIQSPSLSGSGLRDIKRWRPRKPPMAQS